MNKAEEALKAELLELCSGALDEMLKTCPERADFAVLGAQVEKLVNQTLPKTLSNLAEERGIFPLPLLPGDVAKER